MPGEGSSAQNTHDLMPLQESGEWRGCIGVEQDLQTIAAGCSRELLAGVSTLCACSLLTDGNHLKNSSMVEPWSRCLNNASTGTRVPRKDHFAAKLTGFRSAVGDSVRPVEDMLDSCPSKSATSLSCSSSTSGIWCERKAITGSSEVRTAGSR